MEDPRRDLPGRQPDGSALLSFQDAVLTRRATNHFTDEDVPEPFLRAMLTCAAQAPSGYNLQPWRFLVVRDEANRARLRKAAFDQAKVTEAPVVVIALGMKRAWREHVDDVLHEGVRRGAGQAEALEATKRGALQFLDRQDMDVWVTRHTMIAFTHLMLAAEVYGFDTAPMEGFDPAAVKREFGIPDDVAVVALLAIGRARAPIKPYPGRFALEQIVMREGFEDGRPPPPEPIPRGGRAAAATA